MPRYLIESGKNTLYMSSLDVRSNQRWSTHSTMTSWHHIYPTVTQSCQNLTQLQLHSNSVRMHLYAYLPHWKVLKPFIYVHYGCGEQSAMVYSLNHDIIASFPLDSNQEYQKLISQLWQCNDVRVHLYACVPHWKGNKHCIYVQCGCGKQSKVNYRLNHDIIVSFLIDSHPELLKTNQASVV